MNRKQLTDKILNHALGIIYLLTGEEYVVVKKNSPHGSAQVLSGDVPVKCGDISIYFSMEEWDYIEEHKNLYKEVKNGQILNDMKEEPGVCSENQEEEIECVSVQDGVKETETHEEVQTPTEPEPEVIIGEVADSEDSREPAEETPQSETVVNKQDEVIDITADDSVLVRTVEDSHPEIVPEESPVSSAYISQEFPGENYGSFPADPYSVNAVTEPFHARHEPKPFPLVESFLPESNAPWENLHLVRRKSRKQDLHSKSEHIEYEAVPDEEQFNEFEHELAYAPCLGLPEEANTPYICGDCGKCFISETFLAEHLKKHSVERPHRCHECGREFEYRSRLVVHLRTHSGDRPHKCELCGKDFNYRSRLIVHQRKHTGVKPHKCNQCGKQFDYRSHLIRHQRTHT